MKKLVFLLILPIFLVCCTQAKSQSDFYNTWVSINDGGKMEYLITATIFTSTWTPVWITYISPVEKQTFEIFSWEKTTNENADTKNDYPTGYLIGLRGGFGNTTAKLFIHRNKDSLISVYEDRGSTKHDIYIKQSALNISYSEVKENPIIYQGTQINWMGMATNIANSNSGTRFDFLVGYNTRRALEGIVDVMFDNIIFLNSEHPVELTGYIMLNTKDDSFYIKGLSIKQ